MKDKPIKIRRQWKRNPQEQIVPNKKKLSRQESKEETNEIIMQDLGDTGHPCEDYEEEI